MFWGHSIEIGGGGLLSLVLLEPHLSKVSLLFPLSTCHSTKDRICILHSSMYLVMNADSCTWRAVYWRSILGYLLTLENLFSIARARLHSKKWTKDRGNRIHVSYITCLFRHYLNAITKLFSVKKHDFKGINTKYGTSFHFIVYDPHHCVNFGPFFF